MSTIKAIKNAKAKKLVAAASSLLLVGAGCSSTTTVDSNVNAGANVNAGTNTGAGANVNVDLGSETHYNDGTYTVTGKYVSPAGPETINVLLTLKDDVVTDATVVAEATHEISVKKQAEFVGGYKAQVVGKNINEVNVGKVAGSSLTPKGFNDAVAQIKAKAEVK